MPRLAALRFANPNGIQIHQPKVGGPRRTGEERLPWETVPTNSSTLKVLSCRPDNSQPFMAGIRGPQFSKVPDGTKEPFYRPGGTFIFD